MKKLLALGLLVSAASLTGCVKGDVTLADVNSIYDSIVNQENVVVVETTIREGLVKQYENSSKLKSYEKEVTTHTFYNNFYMVEYELEEVYSYGKNKENVIEKSVDIYDFDSMVYYTDECGDGKYTQNSIYSYYDFDWYYSRRISTDFLYEFTRNDFKTFYEVEYSYYTENHSIYSGFGDNLTYEKISEYVSGGLSSYHEYDFKEEYTYSITFKDSKVSVPSSKNLLS